MLIRDLRAVAGLALAALLSACAATGPMFSDVQASFPPLRANEGRIFIFRANTLVGAAVRPEVRLNGTVVGSPQPGSFLFVDRPAGRYTASARTESESQVSFEIAGGQNAYISLQIGMGLLVGRPQLALHGPAEGHSALQGLAYAGATPLVPRAASPAGRIDSVGSNRPVSMDDLRGLLPRTR
jgi:hypothetical protein